jgi:glycosyltransferase involved in cell wall biosynthesis
MNYPLVSIIIPTFNMQSLISETLKNCQQQSYANIEVIVVDDGSTDNTQKHVLSEFPFVKYYKLKHSGGYPSIPRTFGLSKSKGKYIQFLDADDLIGHQKIYEQVILLEEQGSDSRSVAYCDYEFFRVQPDGAIFKERRGPVQAQHWPHDLYQQLGMYTILHRFLYPKSTLDIYGGFDKTLSHGEDLDLWLRLLINGVEFLYIDKSMAFYREHVSHSMKNLDSEIACRFKVITKVERLLHSFGILERYENDLTRARYDLERRSKNMVVHE